MSCIDNCLVIGNSKGVTFVKEQKIYCFDCGEIGIMNKYVGGKILIGLEARTLKVTHKLLLKSYSGEFYIPEDKS